ncbi:hypothetical protein BC830DRAFT_1126298 [Chytriomyces sp. MP71]|nr:hypothetical protein BC830DRAFT_1126298 [Chytriomyces sp. MP71]
MSPHDMHSPSSRAQNELRPIRHARVSSTVAKAEPNFSPVSSAGTGARSLFGARPVTAASVSATLERHGTQAAAKRTRKGNLNAKFDRMQGEMEHMALKINSSTVSGVKMPIKKDQLDTILRRPSFNFVFATPSSSSRNINQQKPSGFEYPTPSSVARQQAPSEHDSDLKYTNLHGNFDDDDDDTSMSLDARANDIQREQLSKYSYNASYLFKKRRLASKFEDSLRESEPKIEFEYPELTNTHPSFLRPFKPAVPPRPATSTLQMQESMRMSENHLVIDEVEGDDEWF